MTAGIATSAGLNHSASTCRGALRMRGPVLPRQQQTLRRDMGAGEGAAISSTGIVKSTKGPQGVHVIDDIRMPR